MLLEVKESYLGWQGSYAAIALFAIQPAVFGEQYYFLTTFILISIFIFSTFYFS